MKPEQKKPIDKLLKYGYADIDTTNEHLSKRKLINLMKRLIGETKSPGKKKRLNKLFDLGVGKSFTHTIGFVRERKQKAAPANRFTFNYHPDLFTDLVRECKLHRANPKLKTFFEISDLLGSIYLQLYAEACMVAQSLDSRTPEIDFGKIIFDARPMHYLSLTLYDEPVATPNYLTEKHTDDSFMTIHGWSTGNGVTLHLENEQKKRSVRKGKALVYFGERAQAVIVQQSVEAARTPQLLATPHSIHMNKTSASVASLQFYVMSKVA